MIEVIGWIMVTTSCYLILKRLFFKKKIIKNNIILDSKQIDHLGPFSGGFKFRK